MQGTVAKNRLRELREDRGFRQMRLAAMLEVHPSAIWRWESNRAPIPSQHIQALTEILGCSADELLGLSDPTEVAA